MQKNLYNLGSNSNADMSQSGIDQTMTNMQVMSTKPIIPKYKTGDDIGPILTYLRQKIKMEQR